MAKILYIGDSDLGSNSYLRVKALKRLGHEVLLYDPKSCLKSEINSKWRSIVHYQTGYHFLQKKIGKWLKEILKTLFDIDYVWINSGEYLGVNCLKLLRQINRPIILYNNDDPTGGRDGRRFDTLLRALPYYDLCAVVRNVNIEEYKQRGVKNVIRVYMSYDEEIHQPYQSSADIPVKFKSEVAFIGAWMRFEKRDEFLLELINKGVPVSIWGGRWHKSPNWEKIKPYYRGEKLLGRDYVAAIQGAKITLGLLSKGNRDLHTRRSVEIPYAGGLFCAERTTEHMEMYAEDKEAVFWSDPEECAEICKKLLSDDTLRESIRQAGMKRVRDLKVGNEDICKYILEEAVNLKK